MKNKIVIGICGKIGSGKTTLANGLSEYYHCRKFNLGDFVRLRARERNISTDRPSLQELGKQLMDEDIEKFCKEAIIFAEWEKTSPLIIAGIRRKSQVDIFKKLVEPFKFILIYIDVKEEIRKERISYRGPDEQLHSIDLHQTEEEVKHVLPNIADIKVDGSIPISNLTSETIKMINNFLKEHSCNEEI